MKILAVLPENMLNQSVHHMMEAARMYGKNKFGASFFLDTSMQVFWTIDQPDYDLIHIHWIEALFDWKIASLQDIERLGNRLKTLRQQGKKIVITRHNSIPHRRGVNDTLLYETGFKYADAVFHMGKFSEKEYQQWYGTKKWSKKQTHHFAPIILFDKLPNTISKKVARQRLGLKPSNFVFMVLGSIRNYKERNLLEQMAKEINKREEILCVAQWPFYGRHLGLRQFRQLKMRLKYPMHHFWAARTIEDKDMQVYLNASDVLISPRVNSLNSGLVALGFSFARTVLGPSIGNINDILLKTGNATYHPENHISLREALNKAKILAKSGKGEENLKFAQKEWSWEKVGQLHVEAYEKIYRRSVPPPHQNVGGR